ncbi:MAG: PhzF family phenazine biosynthesis protein [Planctomycetes bacterium]|nr:PhzF family phenazine biosynthesis protein [Planctomycetota bacterium]
MRLPLFVVDAFAARPFAGNPAAVCPLRRWLPDRTLQAIAAENNLSETAFFVRRGAEYDLRWFTPVCEVVMCGHATLATGHVLFAHLGARAKHLRFNTKSGVLVVTKKGRGLALDLPVRAPRRRRLDASWARALGRAPREVWDGLFAMAVFARASDVGSLAPDFARVAQLHDVGVIVTAPGAGRVDFVSRFFAPRAGIDEDPVTGSAHATLVPYWAERLGRTKLVARQVSRRVGELECELAGERVILVGRAHTYLEGTIRFSA